MENYIVRIYRRDPLDPNKVTGVVESVENETEIPFSSISNLCAVIDCQMKGLAGVQRGQEVTDLVD